MQIHRVCPFYLETLRVSRCTFQDFCDQNQWIQPTPKHYIRVVPAPLMELSSFAESTEDKLEQWEDSSESRQEWKTDWRTRDARPGESTTSTQIPSPITVDSSTTSDGASTCKMDGTGLLGTARTTSYEDDEEDEGDDSDQ